MQQTLFHILTCECKTMRKYNELGERGDPLHSPCRMKCKYVLFDLKKAENKKQSESGERNNVMWHSRVFMKSAHMNA